MAAAALFARPRRARHHQRQGVQISQFVPAAPGFFTLGKLDPFELLDAFREFFSVRRCAATRRRLILGLRDRCSDVAKI